MRFFLHVLCLMNEFVLNEVYFQEKKRLKFGPIDPNKKRVPRSCCPMFVTSIRSSFKDIHFFCEYEPNGN